MPTQYDNLCERRTVRAVVRRYLEGLRLRRVRAWLASWDILRRYWHSWS